MPLPDCNFDGFALYAALDARRREQSLTWNALARQVWDLSAALNAARPDDHPFSTSAISRLRAHGNTGCQHSLLLLWWLDAAPEDFVTDPAPGTVGVELPRCDDAHRLRWNLGRLYATLDAARTRRGATWARTAARLDCSPGQLTGLRIARYSTNMRLAMTITQALRRPAAEFVYCAEW
ncbi:hypothetical protein QNM97_08445 [Gordonia sp. L191]|uniref:hypothetical protein n=1 Tax=Gordonia sp. L191 TaxID=2982699 RepID=UPI0024BF236E|nr:hypothetical protein [Gordonia sp. L191]WHU48988.1 hypothetical protein QNM97_08445 [Gordonia sp. L191]